MALKRLRAARRAGEKRALPCSNALIGFQRLDELRQDHFHIAYNPQIRDVKDRGCRVFVDGDYQAGAIHAGGVLKGAGNTAGEIEGGAHGFSGLSNLSGGISPSGLNTGSGTGD